MDEETQHEAPILSELITFRVPVYVHRQVHTIAEQRQQTVSEYMRGVVNNKLKRQKT
ncbi:MAG: hypothetical protein K0B11_16505 [Mariniphaga sp.]|nr:hypothetical protein [Mariniphaga sp.]